MTYDEFNKSLKAQSFFAFHNQQWRVFCLLVFRPQVNRDIVISAMWEDENKEPDNVLKLVYICICKMRLKLRKFPISIRTAWGEGYYMTKEDRMKAIELAKQAMER